MIKKILSALLSIAVLITLFSACGNTKKEKITDILRDANQVLINGEASNTVEASLGAFEGEQGAFIEFIFPEERTFNTIYIIEKTATVRQFNIYAEIEGKYKLIYTGKNILNENIVVDTVSATALKLEIINTQIGDNHFIIQGVSVYDIKEDISNVN